MCPHSKWVLHFTRLSLCPYTTWLGYATHGLAWRPGDRSGEEKSVSEVCCFRDNRANEESQSYVADNVFTAFNWGWVMHQCLKVMPGSCSRATLDGAQKSMCHGCMALETWDLRLITAWTMLGIRHTPSPSYSLSGFPPQSLLLLFLLYSHKQVYEENSSWSIHSTVWQY